MRKSYEETTERKRREHGAKFSAEELAPQFVPFYESGERIEVLMRYGETKRGTVGITTGWRPCFLLMARRNCIGSSATLAAGDKILRTIKTR